MPGPAKALPAGGSDRGRHAFCDGAGPPAGSGQCGDHPADRGRGRGYRCYAGRGMRGHLQSQDHPLYHGFHFPHAILLCGRSGRRDPEVERAGNLRVRGPSGGKAKL